MIEILDIGLLYICLMLYGENKVIFLFVLVNLKVILGIISFRERDLIWIFLLVFLCLVFKNVNILGWWVCK